MEKYRMATNSIATTIHINVLECIMCTVGAAGLGIKGKAKVSPKEHQKEAIKIDMHIVTIYYAFVGNQTIF
jgi:hypothetical protein